MDAITTFKTRFTTMATRQMKREDVKENTLVRHFKGGYYRIVGIAKDTESDKDLVIYSPHNASELMYARPLDMFLSKVDKTKYPDVRQEYRFELVAE